MSQGKHANTYEEALKLTEGAPDVHRVLAQHAPNRGRGRPNKNTKMESRDSIFERRGNACKSKPVLSACLDQEYSAEYEGYLRGDYKSIRAAAGSASLVKAGHDPLQTLEQILAAAEQAVRPQTWQRAGASSFPFLGREST
jgi:hypothetical protein